MAMLLKILFLFMSQLNTPSPDLFTAQKEIIQLLKSHEAKLEEIHTLSAPLINKWQLFLQVILPIQLEVIKNHGFDNNQAGLQKFNKLYIEESARSPELRALNEQKWLYLYAKVFGLEKVKKITLDEAQNLMKDLAAAVTSEEFLKSVDQLTTQFDETATIVMKREALLNILFPLHMSVMEKHGFEGDEGYIQAQRALMDYYYDPFIMKSAQEAQTLLFKRAKLL